MEWQTDLLTSPVVAITMSLREKTSSSVRISAERSTSCAWAARASPSSPIGQGSTSTRLEKPKFFITLAENPMFPS